MGCGGGGRGGGGWGLHNVYRAGHIAGHFS